MCAHVRERERGGERAKERERRGGGVSEGARKNFHHYFFSLYTYRVLAGGFMKSAMVNLSDKFTRYVRK